ncbi:hypothetical protein [Micromonospora sp. NPDC048898]|uniref:hypothetical protein n=1 Tax=Micromonospora sp. NPDC048898 TaxID=3364260 RepID=UPI003712E906
MSHSVPSRPATVWRHCGRYATAELADVPAVEVMMSSSDDEPVSRGEQIDAAEREEAKRRLLAQAEAERIPVGETTRAVPDRRWRDGR